jgi:hypothetical protein
LAPCHQAHGSAGKAHDLKGTENKSCSVLGLLYRVVVGGVIDILEVHAISKLGLSDDPICERCLEEDKSATHILCDCEAIAYLRFRHLGKFFMEPSDYYDAPLSKVLHFIRGVGLKKR